MRLILRSHCRPPERARIAHAGHSGHRLSCIARSLRVIAWITIAALAGPVFAAPDQGGTVSNSLPSAITTTDGKIYEAPKLLSVAPDGLLIEYRLASGGTGMTKVKFPVLPDSLQRQFGYDPKKASAFQEDEAKAMAAFSQTMSEEEKKRAAARAEMIRPAVPPVVVIADSPTVNYSYYDTSEPRPFKTGHFSDTDGSRAATDRHFKCESDVTLREVRKDSESGFHFAVESVTIHIGLSVTIIVPKTPSPAVMAHSEGHRLIDEHFYAKARDAAQGIGERVAAREIAIRLEDPEKAREQAREKVRKDVDFEYLKHTDAPTRMANLYYDELTNEGRNNVDPNTAARKAIDRFESTVVR